MKTCSPYALPYALWSHNRFATPTPAARADVPGLPA